MCVKCRGHLSKIRYQKLAILRQNENVQLVRRLDSLDTAWQSTPPSGAEIVAWSNSLNFCIGSMWGGQQSVLKQDPVNNANAMLFEWTSCFQSLIKRQFNTVQLKILCLGFGSIWIVPHSQPTASRIGVKFYAGHYYRGWPRRIHALNA